MSTKSIATALSAVLALGLAAVGHTASAQDTGTPSVKVKYADLDLTSEAGARAILQRIHSAAKSACRDRSDDTFDRYYLWTPCVAHATNRAVAALGNPTVTALNSSATAAKVETVAKR
jgi:UrcA family protein